MTRVALVLSVMALFMAAVSCNSTVLPVNMMTCAKQYHVPVLEEFVIVGAGDSPVEDCTFNFLASTVNNCHGLCFHMNPYAEFKDAKVSLEVSFEGGRETFDTNSVLKTPFCTEDDTDSMTVTLKQDISYMFDEKNPGYTFSLEVYNKCGARGSMKNIPFEEAVKNVKGYHYGAEFEDTVRSNYIAGICLGVGLACIFLVVLLLAWCYTRHSPNRGPNRSVGMPKVGGFKKKMNPNKEGTSKDVEMGVRYEKKTETAMQNKPEAKSLLNTPAVTVTADKD